MMIQGFYINIARCLYMVYAPAGQDYVKKFQTHVKFRRQLAFDFKPFAYDVDLKDRTLAKAVKLFHGGWLLQT